MPAHGEPLSEQQQTILQQWIVAGGVWPDGFTEARHWAYIKPVRPALPEVSNVHWPRSPLDYFILQGLDSAGLKPSPKATPEKLIRRLYLDLIGLPPSASEVDAFVADPSEARYEQVVDHLLNQPQFGERWARPWLDLARYADSHGFQRDNLRDMWAYRDWVIAAFNADMPFDQFTIEQLAGDLLPNATESQKIATGFHRTTPVNVEAGSLPEETRIEQVIDRVNTTGAVWLGTTLECCQCHDHKYDPFTQREYYQLLAYFNNTLPEAERTNPKTPSSIDFKSVSIALSNQQRDVQRKTAERQLQQYQSQLDQRREKFKMSLPEWVSEYAARLKNSAEIHPLKVSSFQSQGGTDTFQELSDGAILLQGEDPPDTDVYVVKVGADLADVRGFRLDVLNHDSLPGKGPGRGDAVRRNFVLSDFAAEYAGQPALKFTAAKASFSQKNQPVGGAIDNQPKTGWAISPKFDQAHWATFELSEPMTINREQELVFTLNQNFGAARSIGCFKLSAITGDIHAESVSENIAKAVRQSPDQWSQADAARLLDLRIEEDIACRKITSQMAKLTSQIKQLAPDTTEVMVELAQPRTTTMFQRGDYRQPGAMVQPGTPAVLHPLDNANEADASNSTNRAQDRLELARWLVDRENPLVARVTVNRWWSELFGQGLVSTPEDFGVKGEVPTHPALLDWLACEYMDNGWSLKKLLKTIVMSSTYQQASTIPRELLNADPANVWLARGPNLRMDAEMIRDNALAISGLLNLKQMGPSIRPYQPAGVWNKVGGTAYSYDVSSDGEQHRRGIYVVLKRGTPYPSFINFDANARLNCTHKRSRTNTPLQALTLLNDPVYIEAAEALASRVQATLSETKPDDRIDAGVEIMFKLCTARTPSGTERATLRQLFESQRDAVAQRSDSNQGNGEQSAWQSLATVLLNLHETITKD
ncbi:MAG: DUF1553 domain-containing protein [Pirellulaceae bacterium]|nr:DUF1553 domain-containing protein [Pirellulaceae bacterium]